MIPSLGLNYYPFSDPIVLTDVIYDAYGGNTANTTKEQRQAAYWLAEQKASEDIGTLLAKTIVTGTHQYVSNKVMLEYGYVDRVILTRFIDFEDSIYFTVSGTANVYVSLYDQPRGLVDIAYALNACNCHSTSRPNPYKVQFVYECGLPSGTVFNSRDILLALTTYAEIMVNEIVGFGNEAPGDVGISEFSNQQYSEKRKGLINTVFGASPRANFAHRLLTRLRNYRLVGL